MLSENTVWGFYLVFQKHNDSLREYNVIYGLWAAFPDFVEVAQVNNNPIIWISKTFESSTRYSTQLSFALITIWSLTISKRRRTSFSDSPLYLEVRVDEETLKNVVLHSVATALAKSVFPVPGGPTISTPYSKEIKKRFLCNDLSTTYHKTNDTKISWSQHLPGSSDAFEKCWHPHRQHDRLFQEFFCVF